MNIAVITGASSGMGREFLKRVASEQPVDEIWAIAKEDDKLEELKSEVKVPLKLFACDLTEHKYYLACKCKRVWKIWQI